MGTVGWELTKNQFAFIVLSLSLCNLNFKPESSRMKKSRLLTLSKSTVFLNLIIQSCYTFKLPDAKSEESELSQSIASIFLGDSITGRFGETSGYSGAEASLDTNSDVLLDLIRGQPSDYNAEDYTEEFGYSCVPYYQCSNGSIITDGAGLIDIRNGFGALNPEESKCPGFLDVCRKDPDFVAPPPKPIVRYQPK